MTDFIIKQLPYNLSNQAGLALVGKYLKRININRLVDPTFSVRSGIANSNILKSYLGLLCLGKNDFDAIECQRQDAFFARALDLRAVPSSPTLRQRMDTHAASWFDLAEEINAAVLGTKISGKPIDFGVLPCGYMPLDVDTFAMDNSGTAKEHVGRTLTASRSGGGGDTAIPLLFRADSGFDPAKLMCAIGKQALALKREIAFIIKWNPLTTPVETVAKNKTTDSSTTWTQLREGKRQCLWADSVQLRHGDAVLAARRVYRLT